MGGCRKFSPFYTKRHDLVLSKLASLFRGIEGVLLVTVNDSHGNGQRMGLPASIREHIPPGCWTLHPDLIIEWSGEATRPPTILEVGITTARSAAEWTKAFATKKQQYRELPLPCQVVLFGVTGDIPPATWRALAPLVHGHHRELRTTLRGVSALLVAEMFTLFQMRLNAPQ
jgi:hypothetical protein